MRTARMLAAGANPSLADRRELTRMGSEKLHAFGESLAAMAAYSQRAQMDWWLAFARQWWSPWLKPWWLSPGFAGATRRRQRAWSQHVASTTGAMLDRGLAPLHRTAMANAKRLSRTARR